MKKQFVMAGILGALAIAAIGAVVMYRMLDFGEYAEVVSVEPVFKTVSSPQQQCQDDAISKQKIQEAKSGQPVPQICRTIYVDSQVQDGYQVTYLLNGEEGVVRMKNDPGKRIPLQDGKPDPGPAS